MSLGAMERAIEYLLCNELVSLRHSLEVQIEIEPDNENAVTVDLLASKDLMLLLFHHPGQLVGQV